MTGPLEGRRALVTGASSGIGLEVARLLVAHGASVALLARDSPRLDAAVSELAAVGIPADVRDPESVSAAVRTAASELGGLDAVANVAGVARVGSPSDGSLADWALMFDTNVLGVLAVTKAAIPYLTQSAHSDVVNLSSMAARRISSTEGTVYSASKSAVHSITEGLRRELGPAGVRVSCVSPGWVDTPIFAGLDGLDGLRSDLAEAGLAPGDVARQVLHIISQPPHVNIVEIALVSTWQH